MTRRSLFSLSLAVAVGAFAVVAAGVYAQGQTPKRGGILNTLLIEEPPGLLIHESATVSNERLKLVWEIQRRLEAEVARPMLSWRKEYFAQWPYVKGLVAHNSLYNYGRMQDVWLDK